MIFAISMWLFAEWGLGLPLWTLILVVPVLATTTILWTLTTHFLDGATQEQSQPETRE